MTDTQKDKLKERAKNLMIKWGANCESADEVINSNFNIALKCNSKPTATYVVEFCQANYRPS